MDEDGELWGIGAFARRAGLTPSALRMVHAARWLPDDEQARVERAMGAVDVA
ncbi:hypothetical protein ABTY53_04750 [Streptomyces noursei]|uniref:hypothetical protein n=1 Tax=Streptomyces noursei TaxID=1971 RepID=UPI00332768CA